MLLAAVSSIKLMVIWPMMKSKWYCPSKLCFEKEKIELCVMPENLWVVIWHSKGLRINTKKTNFAFRVRNKDPYNSHCLPLHIAVLVELKKSNCKSH